MSSALPVTEAERGPEEAALLTRLSIFVRMRWLAILGIVAATLVASLGFGISFPTVPIYVICGLIAVYNGVLLRQVTGLQKQRAGSVLARSGLYSNLHIVFDLLALTAILHFAGGIENPFSFYFVFHIIAASIVLPKRSVYTLATVAIMLVGLLVGLEAATILPHYNLGGFVPPTFYQQPATILGVMASLATILYGSAYMATSISGELRKRQREVVELRDQLLKEKTDELAESTQEIAKLEEEKKRFLSFIGVAAHDLKSPLAAIQSYISVMAGGFAGEVNEKQKTMLQRSSVRINELIRLISDLLDIPRIETGQLIHEMKEISLQQVIRESLPEQQRLADEKGLKLRVELPEAPLLVYVSAPRLQQVITNLLANAVAYTPSGSVVVRARDCGDEVEMQVSDTGIGIPAEDLPRIFEDFFRASNVPTKGTGLGLSITRRIVEAHGGRIRVESPDPDRGTGSRFTFMLPKKVKEASLDESRHQS